MLYQRRSEEAVRRCFKAGLYDEIFLSRPWNFYFERKCRNFLNHFENIEKALTIMLLATGVKFDGENEQVKKKDKKICLDETMVKTVSVQVHTKIYFRN